MMRSAFTSDSDSDSHYLLQVSFGMRLEEWQSPDPRRAFAEHHDASLDECVVNKLKIVDDDRGEAGHAPTAQPTDQDHRRLPGVRLREQRPEVGVGGNDHPVVIARTTKNHGVAGGVEIQVVDVYRVVTVFVQRGGGERREVGVNEKPHAGRVSGNSRSRTASAAYLSASVTSSASR